MTAWTDVIGWTLVHFVWEGTAVALIAAVALRALRRASAQARYAVACGGLLLALVSPPVTAMLLLMGATPSLADAVQTTAVAVPSTDSGSIHTSPAASVIFATPRSLPADAGTVASALTTFVAFWAVGVLLLTARLASGWWRVRRLQVEALSSPASEWLMPAMQIASKLGLRRVIHVVNSPFVDTPTVIGWLQPVVLLPIAALANLTPAQVQSILAHELAHIRRHDFIVNLLQTIGETVLFYHPAVWWLSARIRAEREHCCDDIAVAVCGDPVEYAEALTSIAAWAQRADAGDRSRQSASLVVAATSGSLLHRVRRLLRLPDEGRRRRPVASFVIASTVFLVLLVATRLIIVAQARVPEDLTHVDRSLGPVDINRLVGYDLFPGPARYATDDPREARAWDVKVTYPGGEMSFIGFTARGLIRYAYALDRMPVVDGPSWLDTQSLPIHGETSSDQPGDEDFRTAIRLALEGQYGLSIHRESRLFPIYGLQLIESGRLGPNIRPAQSECSEGQRVRPETLGPTLHQRGQVSIPFCGVDSGITGFKGQRARFEDLARALRGFNMRPVQTAVPEREVVDQTGLTGVYDFELDLGFLPLSAIAAAHPNLGVGFGPLIRTIPQALEEQLGVRLVPSEAPREVAAVIATEEHLQAQSAAVEPKLAEPEAR